MNSRLCMRGSIIRLMMMMMMMISGWINLEFFNYNYTTNHRSNFPSLLQSFRAGYTKFSLTNCFHKGRKNNRYTLLKKNPRILCSSPTQSQNEYFVQKCILSLMTHAVYGQKYMDTLVLGLFNIDNRNEIKNKKNF